MTEGFDHLARVLRDGWPHRLDPHFELRFEGGAVERLPVDRWLAAPRPEEDEVLGMAVGPVLDIGCGPGRHTLALHRKGIHALGVDAAPSMVQMARGRGARAVLSSIFDFFDGAGSWASVLLLDGNLGIGGDPVTLFRKVRRLLCRGGRALVEVERPGVPTRQLAARIGCGPEVGPRFPWARVGIDSLGAVAGPASMRVERTWARNDRWFVRLDAI